jgi:hypothetical protein
VLNHAGYSLNHCSSWATVFPPTQLRLTPTAESLVSRHRRAAIPAPSRTSNHELIEDLVPNSAGGHVICSHSPSTDKLFLATNGLGGGWQVAGGGWREAGGGRRVMGGLDGRWRGMCVGGGGREYGSNVCGSESEGAREASRQRSTH